MSICIHTYMTPLRGTLIIALTFALCATGCSRQQRGPAHDAATLIIATTEEPDALDPRYANLAAANDVFALAYDGLVKFGPEGEILPDLATAVPSRANGGISADGRTVVYHLRRGIRWQDGAPFSAADVIYTWRSLMDPHGNAPSHAGYDRIASIDAPTPLTVRVHLRAPYAPATSLFACARQGAIVPDHRVSGYIGTGPYRIVAWQHGDTIEFERNPYARPRPSFARVRLRFIGSEQSIVNGLQTGEIDAALFLTTPTLVRLRDVPGVSIHSSSTLQWQHISFNLRPGSGPQTNLHVRRAIAYALDPAAIRANYFGSLGGLAPLDQAPGSWARDTTVTYYEHSERRARDELVHAGYSHLDLTLLSSTANDERARLEIAMQAALRPIGIDLSLKNLPSNLLLARAENGGPLMSGRYELALFSYVAISPDPNDERYVSSSAVPPNGVNISFYQNPAVDSLVQLGLRTYDRQGRASAYAHIQKRLIADLPFYTLLWSPIAVVTRRDIDGARAVPVGSMLWNIAAWKRAPSSNLINP
jgi:peptide/nickel transport system substrate-binding protein